MKIRQQMVNHFSVLMRIMRGQERMLHQKISMLLQKIEKKKLCEWTNGALNCDTAKFDASLLAINSDENFNCNISPMGFLLLFL